MSKLIKEWIKNTLICIGLITLFGIWFALGIACLALPLWYFGQNLTGGLIGFTALLFYVGFWATLIPSED